MDGPRDFLVSHPILIRDISQQANMCFFLLGVILVVFSLVLWKHYRKLLPVFTSGISSLALCGAPPGIV